MRGTVRAGRFPQAVIPAGAPDLVRVGAEKSLGTISATIRLQPTAAPIADAVNSPRRHPGWSDLPRNTIRGAAVRGAESPDRASRPFDFAQGRLPTHPSLPPRTERSGDPGTRVARHGIALRLWAPDRGPGRQCWCFSDIDKRAAFAVSTGFLSPLEGNPALHDQAYNPQIFSVLRFDPCTAQERYRHFTTPSTSLRTGSSGRFGRIDGKARSVPAHLASSAASPACSTATMARSWWGWRACHGLPERAGRNGSATSVVSPLSASNTASAMKGTICGA